MINISTVSSKRSYHPSETLRDLSPLKTINSTCGKAKFNVSETRIETDAY